MNSCMINFYCQKMGKSVIPLWPDSQSGYQLRVGLFGSGNAFLPGATEGLNNATQKVKEEKARRFAEEKMKGFVSEHPEAYKRGQEMATIWTNKSTLKNHAKRFLIAAYNYIEAKSELCKDV